MTEWVETKNAYPEKEGVYLCYHETAGIGFYDILQYVKDLYKYDKFDFPDSKGKGGFVEYDSEYGSYEVTVEAWTEIPKYKRGKNE